MVTYNLFGAFGNGVGGKQITMELLVPDQVYAEADGNMEQFTPNILRFSCDDQIVFEAKGAEVERFAERIVTILKLSKILHQNEPEDLPF